MKTKDLAHRLIHLKDGEQNLLVNTNFKKKADVYLIYCVNNCKHNGCPYVKKSLCKDVTSFYSLYKYMDKGKKKW